MSSLGEAEIAESRTGILFRGYVGAMARSDEGHGYLLMEWERRSEKYHIHSLAVCHVGTTTDECSAPDVHVFVVSCMHGISC
jgi:hypothetical protein